MRTGYSREFVIISHEQRVFFHRQPHHKAHVRGEWRKHYLEGLKAPPFYFELASPLLPSTLLCVLWCNTMMSSSQGGGNCSQSEGEKPKSAGKGSRVEEEGSWGRLPEEMQKDPAAQHDPGSVFHAGKSNKWLEAGLFLLKTKATVWGGSMKVTQRTG